MCMSTRCDAEYMQSAPAACFPKPRSGLSPALKGKLLNEGAYLSLIVRRNVVSSSFSSSFRSISSIQIIQIIIHSNIIWDPTTLCSCTHSRHSQGRCHSRDLDWGVHTAPESIFIIARSLLITSSTTRLTATCMSKHSQPRSQYTRAWRVLLICSCFGLLQSQLPTRCTCMSPSACEAAADAALCAPVTLAGRSGFGWKAWRRRLQRCSTSLWPVRKTRMPPGGSCL